MIQNERKFKFIVGSTHWRILVRIGILVPTYFWLGNVLSKIL